MTTRTTDGALRVAIVTGAARGIGAATVLALARAGWAVVSLDRCSADPRLPLPPGTETELSAVVADARGLAGTDDDSVVPVVADASSIDAMATASVLPNDGSAASMR